MNIYSNMNHKYQQYMYSYPHKTAYHPVSREEVHTHLAALKGAMQLYIHIPFCQAKCGYCNLFSVASHLELVDAYLDAIERQCQQYQTELDPADIQITGIILGGGTPAMLSVRQFERLHNIIQCYFGVSFEDCPTDIEISPNQADDTLLQYLKQTGFHRVSVGIQSFHEAELAQLNRVHSPEICHSTLRRMKNLNFPVMNADLIYGLPVQTRETLLDSIKQLLTYEPDEIFIYPLYIKPGTPLYGRIQTNDQHTSQLGQAASDSLLAHGYTAQSMRRFTRSRKSAATGSCGFEQSLALGCGGRSYLGNLHICEPYQIHPKDCLDTLKHFIERSDYLCSFSGYLLNDDESKRRFAIKNLLFHTGLSLSEYETLFGQKVWDDYPFLTALLSNGWLVENKGRLCLTETGIAYSDQIGPMFISDTVLQKSQAYYAAFQTDPSGISDGL